MKKLSNLGHIMRLLNISSREFSRHLHVDASLISKWKTGARQVTSRSIYYNEVLEYLLKENKNQGSKRLENFLHKVYPDEDKIDNDNLKKYVKRFLCDNHIKIPRAYLNTKEVLCTAEISIYTDNEGRRRAIDQLLYVAENQKKPGKIITIDCEQFEWLVENEEYAINWTNRMYNLLEKGYTLEVIVHFTLYQENFVKLFLYCNKVLLHKNATMYYHKYFDEDIYWFSFFCLEDAMSVMGLSMTKGQSHSTVFTDTFSVMQHQGIVEFVKKSCNLMFLNCADYCLSENLRNSMSPIIYFNCKLPEILFLEEELLIDVLKENNIENKHQKECLEIRKIFLEKWFNHKNIKKKMIFFYSIDTIKSYVNKEKTPCYLLSFLLGKEVFMNSKQFRKAMETIENKFKYHRNILGCFLEKEEEKMLPLGYGLYSQEEWIFLLDENHSKIGKQSTLLDTSTVAFEQAWRKIPTSRKI